MKIFKKLGCLTLILLVWGNLPVLAEEPDAVTPRNGEELIQVLDFVETPMSDVLRVFAELTGKNIVATEAVRNIRITLFLTEISTQRALEIICKLHNLWFTEVDNVIWIMTAEEYRRELTIHYDEKTIAFHLRYACCMAVADLIRNLFGDRIAYAGAGGGGGFVHAGAGGGGRGGQGLEAQDTHKAFAIDHERGIEGEFSAGATEELERKVEGVGIELADILAAMEKKATVYLAVFPRNNSIVVRSVDRRILEEIEGFIRKVDIPTRQVLLEGKILELALTDDFKSFFDFDIEKAAKHIIDVGGFAPLDAATFIYQFLDEEIEARLELFEEEGLVRVIGTPMILSANNTTGEFFIGEERPIIVDYEHVREVIPEIGLIETVYPIIEVREVGTRLNITPSINEDGTVTLRFLAEVDTVRPGGAEVSFVGPEGRVITLPIDTVDTSRVENIIVASDGSTLAIGGLIREAEEDFERRVPLLGYIPVLGFFFRRKEIRDQKTEIIFLVTPHIMMAPGEAEAVSDEVMCRLSDHPYVHPDDGEEEESRVESQESEF